MKGYYRTGEALWKAIHKMRLLMQLGKVKQEIENEINSDKNTCH